LTEIWIIAQVARYAAPSRASWNVRPDIEFVHHHDGDKNEADPTAALVLSLNFSAKRFAQETCESKAVSRG
jgi:hypothetical protein